MNHTRKNKGFTLIELLVVISIIALLSSVVLASLNVARDRAKQAAFIQSIKQFQLALEVYNNDKEYYPYENSAVIAEQNSEGDNNLDDFLSAESFIPEYLQTTPMPISGSNGSVGYINAAYGAYTEGNGIYYTCGGKPFSDSGYIIQISGDNIDSLPFPRAKDGDTDTNFLCLVSS